MWYVIFTYRVTCTSSGKAGYTLQSATKQTLLFNPPAVLTIHLKRFEQVIYHTCIHILWILLFCIYDVNANFLCISVLQVAGLVVSIQTSRGYVKVNKHVKFDDLLDLSPYCSRFAWVRFCRYVCAVHWLVQNVRDSSQSQSSTLTLTSIRPY